MMLRMVIGLCFIVLIMSVSSCQSAERVSSSSISSQQVSDKVSKESISSEEDETQSYYSVLPIIGDTSRMSKSSIEAWNVWKDDIAKFCSEYSGKVFTSLETKEKIIALTFDDGPDAKVTPMVLDALKKKNIKATFFFQGVNIDRYPNIVKRAYDEGHTIGNHSNSHLHFNNITIDELLNEIQKTDHKIKSIIGHSPALLRPPYGNVNDEVISSITNHRIVIWSLDTFDWVSGTKRNQIAEYVSQNARQGDIILMHSSSGKSETAMSLEMIIDNLTGEGFTFVGVEKILATDAYTD